MYQIERSITGSTSTVVTETGLVKKGEGVLRGILTTATNSGTLKLIDGTENSAVATSTLTYDGSGTIVIGKHGTSTLTSTGASVAATHANGTLTVSGGTNFKDAVKASAVLTSDETQPTAGKKVVVGNETYTFKAAGTSGSRFDVPLGTTTALTMVNLFTSMSGNPLVDVVHTSTYVITVTAKTAGTAGNSIAATEDDSHLDWDGSNTTLTGGLEAETFTIGTRVYTWKDKPEQAYEIKIGATPTASLLNAKYAINASGTTDVNYGVGTLANPQVVAYTSNATTLVIVARLPGASLNSLATTETCAAAAWGGTTLVDGVATTGALVTIGDKVYTQVDVLTETYGATAIPNQFLRGASEATMLDALKAAINGTSVGTLCSTGTTAHPYVIATTNADDSQVIMTRTVGDAAYTAILNALPTTCGMANTAWTGVDITNGTQAAVTTDAALISINGRTYSVVQELSETSGADAIADQILWVSDEATFLDNFKKAINQTGIAGTDYSTGTTKNLDVEATTNGATTQVINARLLGSQGNAITTTETCDNYSWTSTVMASGTGAVGKLIMDTYTPSAGTQIDLNNIEFENGLYIVVGGTSISSVISYK